MAAVSCSFVMCKKGETASSESTVTADSVNVETTNTTAKENAVILTDSAATVLQPLEDAKEEGRRKFGESQTTTDSIAQALKEKELQSAPVSTSPVVQSPPPAPVKVTVEPKIIKETKVVYTKQPEPAKKKSSGKLLTKYAATQIAAEDVPAALAELKNNADKYDAVISREQHYGNRKEEVNQLTVEIPLKKFDYFIADLALLGNIQNQEFSASGTEYSGSTKCTVDITLVGKDSEYSAVSAQPKGFGGKILAALGDGWSVLENIFLFILPFWPLLLAGAGIMWFLRKKKSKTSV